MEQIRYEELAESVRNVWWLQQRTIYDGISSNVGLYAPLLAIYNIFGFSLFTAKVFRLGLQLVSLLCLAAILKRFLPVKYAWFPLVTIGLSPTILYFTTIQTQYGIDMQYLPIVVYLLMLQNSIALGASWAIAMLALMSYPTFLFYLPALVVLSVRQRSQTTKNILISVCSFLAPLVAVFVFVKNRQLLILDSHNNGGIFRGGGQIMFSGEVFVKSIEGLFSDLFVRANSYYFEVAKVEFSDVYPVATVALVVILAVYLFLKARGYRMVVGLAFFTFAFTIIVYGFSFDPSLAPGMRRASAVLATFYVLFTAVWHFVTRWHTKKPYVRWVTMAVLALLPLHHLIVLPFNVDGLKKPSLYRETSWFTIADTPTKSLDRIVEAATKEDLRLGCQTSVGQVVVCRLSEVYAAVAGSCEWNRLPCKNITALDPKTGKLIKLSTKLWEEYYFEH